MIMQVGRDVVPDRAVWSDLVVVSAPMLQLFAGVGKAHEPMRVQAFCPKLAVEGFDEAVVSRLSGPGEVERDVVGIGPQIEISRDELTAVVHSDRPRIPDLAADAFERLNGLCQRKLGVSGLGDIFAG